MGMKQQIYDALVRRNAGVQDEYERYVMAHLDEHQRNRLRHWKLLAALNWHYRVRSRSAPLLTQDAPPKRKGKKGAPPREAALHYPESEALLRRDPEKLARLLGRYDIVSFDLFDTLIFRACASPQDVFWLVGNALYLTNFHQIRRDIEKECRERHADHEVFLEEIYETAAQRYGIDKEKGMRKELELERALCFANPYMQQVVKLLQELGKRIIVTSNMYLRSDLLRELLASCGYDLKEIYVSCEQGCSKRHGALQRKLSQRFGNSTVIHIGDNYRMDVEGSRMAGWKAVHYPNVSELGKPYRGTRMSVLSGSVWQGLVNAKLHSGEPLDPYYEYGYAYAGYLVVGFCKWLNEAAKRRGIDRFLFAARDMDVVYKVYRQCFSQVDSAYIRASRTSSIHLSFARHIDHFFDWHIRRRIRSALTLKAVLQELELDFLIPYLSQAGLCPQELLDGDNAPAMKALLYAHREEILAHYAPERQAGEAYYRAQIADAKHICFVDLGWKGSTASSLEYFLKEICHLDVEISSALLGSEGHAFVDEKIDTGKLESYIFSSQANADIMRVHNRNGDIWRRIYEIIFTSKERSLLRFCLNAQGEPDFVWLREEIRDPQIIDAMQQGIMDFARDYTRIEKRLGADFVIAARDAYRPLFRILHETEYNLRLFQEFEVCFIAGNVSRQRAEMFKDVVMKGGK